MQKFGLKTLFIWLGLIGSLIFPVVSWRKECHSIIAYIAETKLRESDLPTLNKVFAMLNPLNSFFPEKKDSLLEAATIPIEISSGFFGMLKEFRYSDRPIVYWKDRVEEMDIPNPPFSYNITYAMNLTQLIVKQGLDPQHEKNSQIKGGLLDSIMLRYMLNLAGNLHNPINNSSFYSKSLNNGQLVNGDENGLKIEVVDVFGKGYTNLNSLFENAFDLFNFEETKLPYEEEVQTKLESQGNYLMNKYPESYFKNVDNLNHLSWSDESFTIASEFVYSQVEFFPLINPEYIITGRRICEERMALAGYRLYRLLKKLFAPSKHHTEKDKIEGIRNSK